ncbi:hypothetical protein ACHQM5_010540 [Ranunculus cassubicifolius]
MKHKGNTIPSQISPFSSLVIPFLSSHKSQDDAKNKDDRGKTKRMQITRKKVLVMIFFILSALSLLRLLTITPTSTLLAPRLKINKRLTRKEFKFLRNIISDKCPCNLLVFGFTPQYLKLTSLNTNGTTVFLEDNPENLEIGTNQTVYKVKHHAATREAYRLLKHSRSNPACWPQAGPIRGSRCELAMKGLPSTVYELNWDVIVVDGPSGDGPDMPGRMNAIYTAGVIGRMGNGSSDVVVHDVDRMIEKWFSWEFLCEENLVSSKGKFWHFRMMGKSNSTSFCSTATVQIV